MRLRPSQRWSRVVWWTSNNVSEEPAVSSFWASRFLWIHQNARHHMPEDPILALPRELQLWHDTGLICYSLWLRISLLRCIAVSLSAFWEGGVFTHDSHNLTSQSRPTRGLPSFFFFFSFILVQASHFFHDFPVFVPLPCLLRKSFHPFSTRATAAFLYRPDSVHLWKINGYQGSVSRSHDSTHSVKFGMQEIQYWAMNGSYATMPTNHVECLFLILFRRVKMLDNQHVRMRNRWPAYKLKMGLPTLLWKILLCSVSLSHFRLCKPLIRPRAWKSKQSCSLNWPTASSLHL